MPVVLLLDGSECGVGAGRALADPVPRLFKSDAHASQDR
jgi:hypothetical protein